MIIKHFTSADNLFHVVVIVTAFKVIKVIYALKLKIIKFVKVDIYNIRRFLILLLFS